MRLSEIIKIKDDAVSTSRSMSKTIKDKIELKPLQVKMLADKTVILCDIILKKRKIEDESIPNIQDDYTSLSYRPSSSTDKGSVDRCSCKGRSEESDEGKNN